MSNPVFTNVPAETQASNALVELALDLRWTWNSTSHELWGRLDPELWDLTQNPWVVLQTVSREALDKASSDPEFQRRVQDVLREKRESEKSRTWFESAHPDSSLRSVAYFSMEYMLSEALPIYSGGLGNVAGDQLKAAGDLGVPVVGVGLLYDQGYFRQVLDASGAQHAINPYNDPGQLPIKPLREPNGEWLRLRIPFPGLDVWVRGWQVQVGRRILYLLDSNDPANPPAWRGITSELYGGGPELRLMQEIVLGIGGWRLLRALGIHPEVCHLNEGHAAFAVLDRAFSFMTENRRPFDVALAATRAGNLFTTHTPVDAGFDRFVPELIEKYFRAYAEQSLGISLQQFLALGRRDPSSSAEPFNMAYLAVRGSSAVNAVSRLHAQVSRRLFEVLFPRWPEPEIPVGYVTNGVHVPTWESDNAGAVWGHACGAKRWLWDLQTVETDIRKVSDERIWGLRTASRRALVDYTRARYARQLAVEGLPSAEAARIFDPDALTLGFARRFAGYKRPNLLLHDPDRLARILTDPKRPVQLILAGKAHPQDSEGQALIREWSAFLRRPDIRPRAAFLSDYDMLMTQQLVQGVDVWINTPRRPWEASGTSGMKILVNGGLNLSELDGWWAEAYAPDAGWAIGDGLEHDHDPAWDAADAAALYDLLEREIVPEFYARGENGIPTAWVARMRESMGRLTPQFSANRTVRQYTQEHYLPAATAWCERAADGGRLAAEIAAWTHAVETAWPRIRFGDVTAHTRDGQHRFEVQVYLDELDPGFVRVELYAEPLDAGDPICRAMDERQPMSGSAGGYLYSAGVPAGRPASDYTPRLVPFHPRAFVPLELPRILWQR